MRLTKRRLLVAASGMTALGAAAMLVSGVTFGLFSASQSAGPYTFTAGTVTLTQVAQTTCTVGPISPGDSTTGAATGNKQDTPCKLAYTESSTDQAWLAVDLTFTQTKGSSQGSYGATAHDGQTTNTSMAVTSALFDGNHTGWGIYDSAGCIPASDTVTDAGSGNGTLATAASCTSPGTSADTFTLSPPASYLLDGTANGLQLDVNDSGSSTQLIGSVDGHHYSANGTSTAIAPGASGSINDLFIGASSMSQTTQAGTVSLDWVLPNSNGADGNNNAYQGDTLTVTITVHAVQVDNNPSQDVANTQVSAPAGCLVDQTCTAGEIPNWS